MKTVEVSKRSKAINSLLRQARRENVIIRSPEGCEFILAEIDDSDRETELTRGNRRLMEVLDRRARQTRTVPIEEARADWGSADHNTSRSHR